MTGLRNGYPWPPTPLPPARAVPSLPSHPSEVPTPGAEPPPSAPNSPPAAYSAGTLGQVLAVLTLAVPSAMQARPEASTAL